MEEKSQIYTFYKTRNANKKNALDGQ